MSDPAVPATPAASARLYPPIDRSVPQLTLRSVLTGAVLGGTLALCNVYAGLKIGWGMNMSIASVLLSYGFWTAMRAGFKTRHWGIQENNIHQAGASAAASISSAGLVSAVPALTMLSGYQFGYLELVLWVFCCAILGVFTAVLFRQQMLLRDTLPFASGIAAAETLREIYAHGKEAMARVYALLSGALFAGALKVVSLLLHWAPVGFPGRFEAKGALAAKGVAAVTSTNLTLALDPSVLLFGSGAIVGFRTGLWMLIGAVLGWGVIGMQILEAGAVPLADKFVSSPAVEGPWFKQMVEWLLWPGVAMLVTASLTALAFAAPSFVRAFRGSGNRAPSQGGDEETVSPRFLWGALFALGALVVLVGGLLFGMAPHIGLAAVGLTIVLAIVALRVSGETNITPVGGMGKVTQLTFGVIDPGNVATNLMAANVTGGSASQAADMMHDLKTGLLLGTSPRAQAISQCVGVLAGALTGSAIYLVLVDNPTEQLITKEWPAPAVAQWKAVAEVMKNGVDSLPAGVPMALLIAGIAGIVLAIAERLVPARWKLFVPSPTAIGISLCVPAWNAVSFFLGGLTSLVVKRFAPAWHGRFFVVTAAGLIVGESLVGLSDAIIKLLTN